MEKQKLSQTTWFTITMLIVFFPVGIYLMWKNKKFKNNRRIVITTFFFIGCVLAYTGNDHDSQTIPESTQVIESQLESNTDTENDITKQDDIDVLQNDGVVSEDKPDEQEKSDDQTETISTTNSEKKTDNKSDSETFEYKGKSYKIIEVDGGDLSGKREPNVAVDIGFGAREYWALANEYG